ncbi:MAG TPA: hypothetical protein VEW48_09445 [Thermoanaerobaculia bacterium]|nr:hypothetical protein [Thermoanaerobaculia bacterium]
MEATDADWRFTDAEMLTAVGHLENAEVEVQRRAAEQRTRFEQAVFRARAYVAEQKVTPPETFISYALGVPQHERWVEKRLASDLQKAGIDVVLDRWRAGLRSDPRRVRHSTPEPRRGRPARVAPRAGDEVRRKVLRGDAASPQGIASLPRSIGAAHRDIASVSQRISSMSRDAEATHRELA